MKKYDNSYILIAKTLYGLEEVLAKELSQLGAREVEVLNRAVRFRGDLDLMYKSNLYLRTALKILFPVGEFKIKDGDTLYKGVQEIDWSEHFSVNDTFAVDANISTQIFNHSGFVALKVKDAIVDQFRERKGRRPSVDVNNPHIRINVHIADSLCTISLDSSGEPLFKRGYRTETDAAPLNEVLAAGMIMLSEWDKKSNFIDPMCGSGTLLIEGALYALNIPPCIKRKTYGFMNWKNFDEEIWEQIFQNALHKFKNISKFEFRFIGSDISEKAYFMAKRNVKNIELENVIELKAKSISNLEAPEGRNTIITNPPYGERIKTEDIEALYALIGERLKHNFTNSDAWILSSNMEAIKRIGLKASKKITLFNGSIECKFLKYSLFEGRLKNNLIKTQEDSPEKSEL